MSNSGRNRPPEAASLALRKCLITLVLASAAWACGPIAPIPAPEASATRELAAAQRPAEATRPVRATSRPKEPTSSPTMARIPVGNLAPGDYIAFSSAEPSVAGSCQPASSLYLVSRSGTFEGLLAAGPGAEARISPDGQYIVFTQCDGEGSSEASLALMKIEDGTTRTLAAPVLTSHISWSPEGGSLLFEDDTSWPDLFLLAVADHTATRVTSCESQYGEGSGCANPLWSPDGRQIALEVGGGDQMGTSKAGTYLMRASCLTVPPSCAKTSKGPLRLGEPQTWSPDGRYLAFNPGQGVTVYDTKLSSSRDLPKASPFHPNSLAWSPDGQEIAMADGSGVYVLDAITGESTLLTWWGVEQHVAFWLHK